MDFRIMKKKAYLVTQIIWSILAFAVLIVLLTGRTTLSTLSLSALVLLEAGLLLAVYMTATRNGGLYMRLEEDSLRVMTSLLRKPRFPYKDIRSLRVLQDEMTLSMKTGREVRIRLDPMDQETRKAFVRHLREKLKERNA